MRGNSPRAPIRELAAGALLSFATLAAGAGPAHALPGAIFTTVADGSVVNVNGEYRDKEEVYLDGGPGPNAPSTAASLPPGDYYFQVTDPSGRDLLSTDHISCRRFRVNDSGVIDAVYSGTDFVKERGDLVPVTCTHDQGVATALAALGAITVQLHPYTDTPNRGGVYKVWVTPVWEYTCDPDFQPSHQRNIANEGCTRFHGFVPRYSKTDTYKVRSRGGGPPWVAPALMVREFHDRNTDGVEDPGEEEILGWAIDLTDPLGVENTLFTRVLADVSTPGDYGATQETLPGTLQTVGMLDGSVLSSFPAADPTVTVPVLGDSGETHEVVFGNVGVGEITACKVLDFDADGVPDPGEPPVPGWRFELTGLDASGAVMESVEQATDSDGCTTFADLLPGDYSVEEVLPLEAFWIPMGEVAQDFAIESVLEGSVPIGTSHWASFTNLCLIEADFGTKGYWHNKNGLSELSDADIAFVNGLEPYKGPSSYFGAGDEPFDGIDDRGDSVPAAEGTLGEEIATEGSARAEISAFLVDPNAGGDPREQLAQQLLAFVFNTLHRVGSPDGAIQMPDGSLRSAQTLIEAAIAAWSWGSEAECRAIQELLDALNNADALPVASSTGCPITYP